MPQAVTITNLIKRFGDTTTVDGVDLEVAVGEVFGLVGPNGAGKTTLLQFLAIVLTFMPTFLFSGFLFAIASMPPAFQAYIYLLVYAMGLFGLASIRFRTNMG